MNTRRFSIVLMVVCLPIALLAALPAPTGLTVTAGETGVALDWDDVEGATKYSVDLEGTVNYTYWDETLGTEVPATADAEISFGTSDRTDDALMSDSNLTITLDELAAALAARLGVDTSEVVSFEGSAKVKALNPGKGNGPQNNPFSDSAAVSVTF